jgi:hypothetical protein
LEETPLVRISTFPGSFLLRFSSILAIMALLVTGIVQTALPAAAQVNPPPVAVNDTANTFKDTPVTISVLANDTGALYASNVTAPLHGTWAYGTSANNTIVYTPASGYVGADSFTYRAFDGQQYSLPATVAVSVLPAVAPSIQLSPVIATVPEGNDAPFIAVALGQPAPSVQWQRSTDNGSTWPAAASGDVTNIPVSGGTSTTLVVRQTALSDNGTLYRAYFYNTGGNVTSTAATLVVLRRVTPSVTVSNKVYDGTISATILTRTLSGVVGSDNVTLIGGTATFATASVGNNKTVTVIDLRLDGPSAVNYALSSTTATATAAITSKTVTPNVTVYSKVYDGNNSATIATRTLAGAVGGDDVALTGGTATFDTANIGNNKTVTVTGLDLSGSSKGNYSLSSANLTTIASITAQQVPSGGGGGGGGGPSMIPVALTGLTGSLTINIAGSALSTAVLTNSAHNVTFTIPAGTTLRSSGGSPLTAITLGTASNVPATPQGKFIILPQEFGPDGATFDPPITLTLNYVDGDIPSGASEQSLVIVFWNGTAWVEVPGTVDAAGNTVTAPITHFSLHAVMGTAPVPPPSTTSPPTTTPPASTTPPATTPPTTSPPTTTPPPTSPAATSAPPTVTSSSTAPTTTRTVVEKIEPNWPGIAVAIVVVVAVAVATMLVVIRRRG